MPSAEDIRRTVVVMAANGKTASEIMQATGVPRVTITRITKDAGIPLVRKLKKVTAEARKTIADMHRSGMQAREIACETGYGESTINREIAKLKACEPEEQKQPEVFQIPLGKDKQIEALCMMREAIQMLLETMYE